MVFFLKGKCIWQLLDPFLYSYEHITAKPFSLFFPAAFLKNDFIRFRVETCLSGVAVETGNVAKTYKKSTPENKSEFQHLKNLIAVFWQSFRDV